MKRPGAILLLLPLFLLTACAASLQKDYDHGAVTPFAGEVIAESRAPAKGATPGAAAKGAAARNGSGTAAEEDAKIAKVKARLDRLKAEWEKKAKQNPGAPERFGLDAAASATEADLKSGLTLGKVLAAAHTMSPAVKAARERLRATVDQFDQVSYLDALLRQYVGFTKDLDLRIGAPRQKQMIEAFFPFPGTMALKTDIVADDAKAADERLAKASRVALVSAGKSYYEIAYLKEAIQIVGDNIQLLDGMVNIAEAKYGVGKARQGVVLKAHVEIASLEDQLVTLKEKLATERSRLASTLGLPADFPFGDPAPSKAVPPPVAPDPLYPIALANRQEIVALKSKIAGTESLIELAETKAYPDLTLGFSRFEEGGMTRVGGARMAPPFSTKDTRKPKFWFGETASFIQEMRDRLSAMKKDLADLQAKTRFEVKDAWFTWDTAWRLAELHRTSLLPQAKQAYQVMQSGWQEGVADFLDTLDAQRTWLEFRLKYQDAIRMTNVGRLSLVNAMGAGIPDSVGRK